MNTKTIYSGDTLMDELVTLLGSQPIADELKERARVYRACVHPRIRPSSLSLEQAEDVAMAADRMDELADTIMEVYGHVEPYA